MQYSSPSEDEGLGRAKPRPRRESVLGFARTGSSSSLGQKGRAIAAALLLATPAFAQTTTSPAPSDVAVSIYRAPARGRNERLDLDDLRGFALVTETRTVDISAGEGTIRFEGVASGILPESAIVSGLPEGVSEKNQDANQLSPASLLGASVGRRVSLRRTSRATGAVREENAVIRSGPGGQVVLQTTAGFEALRCSGLPETIVYDTLPPGLSAKPVLSVRTTSRQAMRATVTLSYLADNFDWQANYVATLSPDRTTLDLFGWVTMASADETSFPRAQAAVIAGRLNRSAERSRLVSGEPSIALQCWPTGTTSDIPMMTPPPPMAEAPMAVSVMSVEDIVVTGMKRSAVTVQQEELGDLKLYRVPERVTVAARAQKQVALLDKAAVPVTLVWRTSVDGDSVSPVRLVVRARNRTADGLGLPLPQGKVALYANASGGGTRQLLLGEGGLDDRAVGEDVEIEVATASSVTARVEEVGKRRRLTITNANAYPVALEVKLGADTNRFDGRVGRKDGQPLWSVRVPANGSAALSFSASVKQ